MKRTSTATRALSTSNYGTLMSDAAASWSVAPQASPLAPSVAFASLREIPRESSETLQQRFDRLVQSWVEDVRFTNSMNRVLSSEPLRQIISLGEPVIPLIFEDLAKSRRHWFYALHVLTGADPAPKSAAGNMEKLRASWLKWGEKHGYVAGR
jgi:hypothetical protein